MKHRILVTSQHQQKQKQEQKQFRSVSTPSARLKSSLYSKKYRSKMTASDHQWQQRRRDFLSLSLVQSKPEDPRHLHLLNQDLTKLTDEQKRDSLEKHKSAGRFIESALKYADKLGQNKKDSYQKWQKDLASHKDRESVLSKQLGAKRKKSLLEKTKDKARNIVRRLKDKHLANSKLAQLQTSNLASKDHLKGFFKKELENARKGVRENKKEYKHIKLEIKH